MNACTEFRRQITRLFLANRRAEENRELGAHLISCKSCKGFRAQLTDMQTAYARLPQVAASFQTLQRINRELFAPPKERLVIPWDLFGKGAVGLAVLAALFFGVRALVMQPTDKPKGASAQSTTGLQGRDDEFQKLDKNAEKNDETVDPWETLIATRESVLQQSSGHNKERGKALPLESDRFDQISNKLKQHLQTELSVAELETKSPLSGVKLPEPSDKMTPLMSERDGSKKSLPERDGSEASPSDPQILALKASQKQAAGLPSNQALMTEPQTAGLPSEVLPMTVKGPAPAVSTDNKRAPKKLTGLSALLAQPELINLASAIDELELPLEACDSDALFWAAFVLETEALTSSDQASLTDDGQLDGALPSADEEINAASKGDSFDPIDISPETIEAYLSAGMPYWQGLRADLALPGRTRIPGVLSAGLNGLGTPWLGSPGGALPGGGGLPWLGEAAGDSLGGLGGLAPGGGGASRRGHLRPRRPRTDIHLNSCPVMAASE